MNTFPSNFRELEIRDQKEFIFEIMERCRHSNDFYKEVVALLNKYESPYDSTKIVAVLKPR
jgi:hypothetical protein